MQVCRSSDRILFLLVPHTSPLSVRYWGLGVIPLMLYYFCFPRVTVSVCDIRVMAYRYFDFCQLLPLQITIPFRHLIKHTHTEREKERERVSGFYLGLQMYILFYFSPWRGLVISIVDSSFRSFSVITQTQWDFVIVNLQTTMHPGSQTSHSELTMTFLMLTKSKTHIGNQ